MNKVKKYVTDLLFDKFPHLHLLYMRLTKHKSYEDIRRMHQVINGAKHELKINTHRTDEQNDIYERLKKCSNSNFSVYPYPFVDNYNYEDVMVYYDERYAMHYVLHKNKPLYFPKHFTVEFIKQNYNNLIKEQDKDSPHCYETDDCYVKDGDVVIDAGTAEGNFALDVIDRAKKLYLFEVNPAYIECLKVTFAPYKDKVIIVNKYVTNINNENCITLDNYFENEKIDFIKADIEGEEINMLLGAKNILAKSNPLKMALCTYHRANDAQDIEQILKKREGKIMFSKGYMIFIFDKNPKPPYLRHGLIRYIRN